MATKRTRKLLAWALCLCASLGFSQTTFQKTIGGSGNETATWVAPAADGYIVAGQVTNASGNQDALLLRLDASGNTVWQKRFGAAQADIFNCVLPTPDGGFLAVGETRSFGAGNVDIFLVKVDGAGTVLWSKTIGDAAHDDNARSVVAVAGGGFIVSGYSAFAGTNTTSSIFIRLDAYGNTVWSRTYNSTISNVLLSNYIDGNVIYASGSADAEGVFVRLDLATGNLLSSKAYAGIGSEALSYQLPTQDGNMLIADHTWSAQTGTDIDAWVQKINKTNGQVIWSKVYYRDNDNIRARIEKVDDGGFLLVPYDNFNTTQADAILAKIDANGNLLWSYNYGGNAADRLMKAIQTSDGGFIAVGDTRSSSFNANSDILIVKTNSNGRINGSCVVEAGIKSANFSAMSAQPQLSETVWLQSAGLNTAPLPISMMNQSFNPNAAPHVLKMVPLCQNTSFNISGVNYFPPKMVTDTISHVNGCDTIIFYDLTLMPFNLGLHVIGLCSGETYTIDGVAYTAPTTVIDTIPSLNGGCDTLCTFVLKAWAQPTLSQTISFCAGETVMIGGHPYTQSGMVQAAIPSHTGGCDTLATYTLIAKPRPTLSRTVRFCPGESVLIAGVAHNQPGTVFSTIPCTTGGCDTVITYTLEFLPQPTRAETRTFCAGQSISIGGQTYSQSGTVIVNLASTTNGCDTVVTYTLDLRPQPTRAETRALCAGQSVTIGGQSYTQSGTVIANLASTTGGCDTVVTYTLNFRPQPIRTETRSFCPGNSVTIGGQTYTQPGTVVSNISSATGGCDTIVTYTLELRPQPTRSETRSFCPGQSVTIAGQTYNQPGTFIVNISSTTGGCDTVVTYTLEQRPQPTRSETRSFCPGEMVSISGHNFTQPGVITVNYPSTTGGCDTAVTYTLQQLTPSPSNVAIHCPSDITVLTLAGAGSVQANYAEPLAASDCICPGLSLNRTTGLPSGSLFPMGATQVCYSAKDNCGQEKPCCFSVNVREEDPCDVKVNGCIKYELLSISSDPAKNFTYRVRVTNSCTNKLIYTAIEIPDGLVAMQPDNNTTYTSPNGRNYIVRSPNFSPMYSIRFKSTTDSISNGRSDVFEYTLPAQSDVRFINITSRLAGQNFNEAHLNTFNCPVGVTPANQGANSRSAERVLKPKNSLLLFPNPTTGVLYADLSDWQGQQLQVQITNAQGQVVHTMHLNAADDLLQVEMPKGLTAGVYFFEMRTEKGEKEISRFVLQR